MMKQSISDKTEQRRASRRIRCGTVDIGGGAPVSVQSMLNVPTADVDAALAQMRRLAAAGCQIVRLTVNDQEAADGFARIKKAAAGEDSLADLPLVADIHFDHRMAIAAMKGGADKIRINPGNIGSRDRIKAVADMAADRGIPIRVGVNSGSLEQDILNKYGGVTAQGLAESALRNAEILEDAGFSDIVISLKSSDVRMNDRAYRIVADACDYPLHVGVTEAGTLRRGIVKSAIGVGSLLLDGIGDTMRVSLTADPVEEVIAAKQILDSLDLRSSRLNIVSCPTCGRTQVDLEKITEDIERALAPVALRREKDGAPAITVAVMGCAVNGPGESRNADIGVACGKGEGLIFAGGKPLMKVPESDICGAIVRMVEELK